MERLIGRPIPGATGLGFWMLFAKSHQECALAEAVFDTQ